MARQRKKNKILTKRTGEIVPMYDNFYGAADRHHQKTNTGFAFKDQPQIVDKKSTKHFGILLSTQQSIEEFQAKSGMLKAFTTEYQFHYWALVARIQFEDEILDIAIPTVMFNYKQEVNGAAVSFHLNDVEEASVRNQPVAEAIANVLINSTFGKFLIDSFKQVEWMNVPMNTCHVHPGSLSTFSGTDYSKTMNDPGICFPLSEPHAQPSFSSIVCHSTTDGHIGKVVRTEYRFADKEDKDIVYYHGTCLAYWKGYIVKGYKKELPIIKGLFTNKQFDERADAPKPAYINTDGMTIVLENNVLLNAIIKEFDALEFSPHTEDILAERIEKYTYKAPAYGYNHSTYVNTHTPAKTTNDLVKKTSQVETLQANTKLPEKLPNVNSITIVRLREILVQAGYSAGTVYSWDWAKCREMYESYIEAQHRVNRNAAKAEEALAEERREIIDGDEDIPMTPDEMINFLINNGVKVEEIRGKSLAQIELIFEAVIEEIEEFEKEMSGTNPIEIGTSSLVEKKELSFKNNLNVRMFLNKKGISDSIIDSMTEDSIALLLEEFNW